MDKAEIKAKDWLYPVASVQLGGLQPIAYHQGVYNLLINAYKH